MPLRIAALLWLLWPVPCTVQQGGSGPMDTARFYALLDRGDAIYRQKQGYGSLLQSLPYFDSAAVLAEQSGNALMMAKATAARGRIYDAWDREPDKTIALFSKAGDLFGQAGDEQQQFYYKHLVAHIYEKAHDSTRATAVLRDMMAALSARDTAVLRRFNFIPEMALIATEVHAYPLADSILRHLTRRAWIANDPTTYNYLDHYYLSQSRLDIYWRRQPASAYLDSLAATFADLTSLFDRRYYASVLADLYGTTGEYATAFKYRSLQNALTDSLMASRDIEGMQRALEESETAAARRQAAYEATLSRARSVAVWVLSALLAVITVLSIYLYQRNKKYRAQSRSLQTANAALDKHAGQVELLNKEIQHRIKNNLYTIYSLLHMQEESTDNEEVQAHLGAARMRVESVAALHDHLLGSTDAVDFSAYLKVLVSKVVECFADERRVVTHIRTEPVTLPVNTCFALSLILNEWITNSIKYARTRNEVLNMEVSIGYAGGEVCIEYADDGHTPEGDAPKTGLGTEIIRLLTAQVRGRLSTAAGHPYHYYLCIPHGRPDQDPDR